jgi:diguanylate cyclase (GGDEF)-like protein
VRAGCAPGRRATTSTSAGSSRACRAPLTGALNRRGFDERFAAELDRADRAGTALGLILVDLDDFKRTNDVHGHAAGDEQLRWAVRAMTALLRPSDAVGRLGGDEFAVLVPGAGRPETAALAGRLRAALAEGAPASLGVASFPADGDGADALHQVADLDLYAIKHGRSSRRPAAGSAAVSWAAALARAVDERMAIRHEHSMSVARYAVLIAERLGYDEDGLGLAAILRVGKIAVPEEILREPEPLTEAERRLVERHAAAGAEMVARSRASRRSHRGCATRTSASMGPATGTAWPAATSRSRPASSPSPTRSTR